MEIENMQTQKLCKIRDVYRAISEFEIDFQKKFDLGLNEGMMLCSLNENKYSSSQIAEMLGLTNSNASKVIKSVENKGLVKRILGKEDKRQMYFVITLAGKQKLESIKCEDFNIPKLLMPIVE